MTELCIILLFFSRPVSVSSHATRPPGRLSLFISLAHILYTKHSQGVEDILGTFHRIKSDFQQLFEYLLHGTGAGRAGRHTVWESDVHTLKSSFTSTHQQQQFSHINIFRSSYVEVFLRTGEANLWNKHWDTRGG